MIPYFEWKEIVLGPLHLQVWGLFVAAGFVFGAFMAAWMAKRRGQDTKIIWDLTAWLMLAGLIGGRLGYVVFYDLPTFIYDPIRIIRIWEGGSSVYGGFIACLLVGIWYLKRHKVDVWRYADTLMFGLPFGYAIGRIGCFLIHDHPGTATNFFLGVKYPDGVTRHDHGLYLSLQAAILSLIFLWISHRKLPDHAYLAGFSLWYGAVRFFLDFYRTADVRYAGLTPAQYLSIGLFAFGVWQAWKIYKRN